MSAKRKRRPGSDPLLLPCIGGAACIVRLWAIASATWSKNLPSPREDLGGQPGRTCVEPFAKRGELDQGILRFTWYSLVLVAKGYALALLIGTPLGFFLGRVEAVRQELRPDHPDAAAGLAAGLAAAGAGAVPEVEPGGALHHRDLLDVADGAEHRAGGALDPAGLPERRPGAAALARPRRSSRSCCRRRCPTCSPASASAWASPGW